MSEDLDLEIKKYIEDTVELVTDAANSGRAVHTTQSFGGYRRSSAVVVCLLACPEDSVLEVQEAIDQAVLGVLGKPPWVEASVQ